MEDKKKEQQTEEQKLCELQTDSLLCHQSQEVSAGAWKIYIAYGSRELHCHAWAKTGDQKKTLDEFRENLGEDIYTSIAEYKNEKREEEQIAAIREIYVELPSDGKFLPSSEAEGIERILGHFKEQNYPAPSLIVYDGQTYIARWTFTEPIDVKYLPLWKRIEEELAEKCFDLVKKAKRFSYENDYGYMKSHSDATAILPKPGFNNSDTGQEVRVIYATGATYTLAQIAASIFQSTEGIREYRKLQEECGVYKTVAKKKKGSKAKGENQAETCRPEDILAGIRSHVVKYHQSHRNGTHVYITEKNPDKHKSTDRSVFHSSCRTSELESYVMTMHTDRDYWMSVCEYSIKLYENSKPVTRRDGGKIRTGTRNATTAKKKWAELVQMNFLVIDPRKSEISPKPTLERLIELVLERCSQRKMPKPEIVNDGEKLEVKWIWHDVMKRKNPPSKDEFDNEFNPEYEAMQKKLCGIFLDLGVDERKLQVTTALRVPGTLNTRTNTLVRVAVASEENISYRDMMRLLNGEYIATAVQPSMTENVVKKVSSVPVETYSNVLNELSDCSVDVLSLHSGGDGYVFICLENKAQGEDWREWAVQASDLPAEIMKLKQNPEIDSYNVYISQAEFYCKAGRKRPERKTNRMTSCFALFVDLDWKLSGHENITAEEGKAIVLRHCAEKGIPLPSEIVHSGNGSHVKYFFTEAISRIERKRWEALEEILCGLYSEVGADKKATDITRVLRLPGTKNCKLETVDRDVRITYTGRKYDFAELATKLEALGRTPISPSETTNGKNTASSNLQDESLDIDHELEELAEMSVKWFYVMDRTTGKKERIADEELRDYLNKQDRSHQLEMSVVRYKGDKTSKGAVDNMYYSYVILTDCPGETIDEQIKNIKTRCRKYRGKGIPEPNQIIQDGDRLIVLWRYTKDRSGQELPGYALPRWKVTQEFMSRHFECWGAMKFADTQKYTAMLPLPGFIGTSGETVKTVYKEPSVSYIFDKIACAVLNFSQAEVKEYLKQKAQKKAEMKKLMEEVLGISLSAGKATKFAKTARRIFKDILKLLSLRKTADGFVREGHREQCVFYALDEAIMAGYVNTVEEFDALALRLIEFCGGTFNEECGLKTFGTLRRRFANGEAVYHFQRRTLIENLDIQEDEQAELEVLRLSPSERAKPVPQWKLSGKPRSTYYRHLKKKRVKEVVKADDKKSYALRVCRFGYRGLSVRRRSETEKGYIMMWCCPCSLGCSVVFLFHSHSSQSGFLFFVLFVLLICNCLRICVIGSIRSDRPP